jgi:hypothetical protein
MPIIDGSDVLGKEFTPPLSFKGSSRKIVLNIRSTREWEDRARIELEEWGRPANLLTYDLSHLRDFHGRM